MDDAPPSQSGVVHHLGRGQGLVGLHDDLAVIGLQLGVVQGDLPDGALGPVHLDDVADAEGVGGQDHQSPGHVAQDVLRRQGHAQGQHRHDGRQRRGVDAQCPGGDDGRQHIQHRLYGGEGDLPQPVVQLLNAIQKPCHQLHHQMHHRQTDQQRQDGGENMPQGEPAQGC